VQFSCDPNQPGFNPQSCFLPAGGFTLWELQNEVRVDISGPLSAAIFCDMGDVSPSEGNIRLGYLHLSCGVGAAYDTPAGPIRVDIGYRVQPLQVLGYKNETAAYNANPLNGAQPTILGVPLAIAIGIGQAY
jgi:outer membrane protein insertion porin family/translocation and assembly module TamA